ncbi:MarR family transcriptional regulator [Planktotalea sp.]|uniref:MarR family winged helix-turn-helix transcriptional regulator n=1 Tax=Planktotalea sp. TaxID=2029877 RepID=UPI0025E1B429|nr:MarR family transcriptional regulator [Planktotalea sp.]
MKTPLTADGDPKFVADYLLFLLAAASDGASAQFHAKVRSQGLRVPEWRVLACLHDRDGAMITQLARIALVEQSRLTRIIVQMEERELLIRQSDPDDGRRVRVFLTPAGRALTNQLVPQAQAHEQALLERLSHMGGTELDAAELKPMLRALMKTLEQDATR